MGVARRDACSGGAWKELTPPPLAIELAEARVPYQREIGLDR